MTDDGDLKGQQVRGGVMAQLRQERGLSIEECAGEADLTVERWNAIEGGLSDCLADEIADISKALGLSGVELYKRWGEAMVEAGLMSSSPPPRKELSPEEQERIVNEVAGDILMKFGFGGSDEPSS